MSPSSKMSCLRALAASHSKRRWWSESSGAPQRPQTGLTSYPKAWRRLCDQTDWVAKARRSVKWPTPLFGVSAFLRIEASSMAPLRPMDTAAALALMRPQLMIMW
jgi:hypothetical protein